MNLSVIENDIQSEITAVRSSKRRQKSFIDAYELESTVSGISFYKVFISDSFKCQEEERVTLKASGTSIQATVVKMYDENLLLLMLKEELTEELYHIVKFFDPTFILNALSDAMAFLPLSESPVLKSLMTKELSSSFTISDEEEINEDLNHSQMEAVKNAEEKEISVIWGPPGTGKTHTLAEIVYRAYLRDERVLVVSTSNVAIDQLILYLDKKIYEDEKSDFLRLGSSADKVCESYIQSDKDIEHINIVFSTLATVALKSKKLMTNYYDTVIIDEASMVSLPYVYLAASLSKRNIILAGDYLQLPPISMSGEGAFAENVFTYLQIPQKIRKNITVDNLTMLDTQYRMTSEISEFISSNFYHNKLKCGVTSTSRDTSIFFVETSNFTEYKDSYYSVDSQSYYNPVSIGIVDQILKDNSEFDNILYLTPFRSQQSLITSLFLDKKLDFTRSLTVHKSQGSEADVVIFDMTVYGNEDGHQLLKMFTSKATFNLINVALSRAKKRLYFVGGRDYLNVLSSVSDQWRNFKRSLYRSSEKVIYNSIFRELDYIPLCDDFKIAVGVDPDNRGRYLPYIQEAQVEKKVYVSSISRGSDTSGVTYRKIGRTKYPEFYALHSLLLLRHQNTYVGSRLPHTAMLLSQLIIGHIFNTSVADAQNSYILNCESCGQNKVLVYDPIVHYYVLKCQACGDKTFISESIANDIKVLHDIKCPECRSEVIPRRKRGSRSFSFWGCSNYPDCDGLVPFSSVATKL